MICICFPFLEYNESGCTYVPLLCMVGLLYFNMIGFWSHNETTDLCIGANYEFSPYVQWENVLRQEPEGA